MSRIRIGVVGCGLIGQMMHLPHLKELHDRVGGGTADVRRVDRAGAPWAAGGRGDAVPAAAEAVRSRAGRRCLAKRSADPGTRTTGMAQCVVSLWHDPGLWRDRRMRQRVARIGAEVRSVAMVGACFSLAYVAAGRLDACWERQAHPWDVAAWALLVRQAGGRVTGGAGQPFDVDEATLVASNGRIHGRMVALLNGRRPPAYGAR